MSRVELSVVVPTRNRPDHVSDCAASLLAAGGFDELLFVDQSDGPESAEMLAGIGDERVRCIRSDLRGATNARNVGIEHSRGSLIAFTDDDCRVARNWCGSIRSLFESDPEIAVVCGRVDVPEELASEGFAIGFVPAVREWQSKFPPPDRDWGITANMSVRRSVFETVGLFDPLLGPGAPLRCGEEPDLLFRVLDRGMKVVNADEVRVSHLGIRKHGPESSQLWDAYGAGTAAALFKHVRLGNLKATQLWLGHVSKMVVGIVRNVVMRRRPVGARYALAFLQGTRNSLRYGVDRSRRIYVQRSRRK